MAVQKGKQLLRYCLSKIFASHELHVSFRQSCTSLSRLKTCHSFCVWAGVSSGVLYQSVPIVPGHPAG
jgi:hypothetical protein